jgi:hypothetical protein
MMPAVSFIIDHKGRISRTEIVTGTYTREYLIYGTYAARGGQGI